MNVEALNLATTLVIFVVFVFVTMTVWSVNMVTDKMDGGTANWGIWKVCSTQKDISMCSSPDKTASKPSANKILKQSRGYAIASVVTIFIAALLSIFSMKYNNMPLMIALAVISVVFFAMAVVTTVLVIMFASKNMDELPASVNRKMGNSWWIYLTATVLGLPMIVLSSLSAKSS